MFAEQHGVYVPHQGTFCKRYLYPTGVLGGCALSGHTDAVLPNNIAQFRKRSQLSQEALALKVGTTRSMLTKLERGERDLTTSWLERLSEALGCEGWQLIAPARILPTEDELAEMLASAQRELQAGLPYSEWPRAVASGLHMRLQLLAGDRANADSASS